MAKSKPVTKTERTLGDDMPPGEPTTLSIRVTAKERKVLAEAAEVHGVTLTRLIKSAAVTRAVHIVNTSTTVSFDFDRVAETAADLLFTQEIPMRYRVAVFSKQASEGRPLCNSDLDDEQTQWKSHSDWTSTGKMPVSWKEFKADYPQVLQEPQEPDPGAAGGNAPIVRMKRRPMSKRAFYELRKAVDLGGTEFLKKIFDRGKKFYALSDFPDPPLEPQAIGRKYT